MLSPRYCRAFLNSLTISKDVLDPALQDGLNRRIMGVSSGHKNRRVGSKPGYLSEEDDVELTEELVESEPVNPLCFQPLHHISC